MMERLRRCVHDELFMYATLAYGPSCMGWTLGIIKDSRPPEYFIDKALQSLRVRLSSPDRRVDTWLLLSIYALAITKLWNGVPQMWEKIPSRLVKLLQTAKHCREASRVHLRALVCLVNDVGGWKGIDPYVLESMILVDKFLAIADGTLPILPLAEDVGALAPYQQRDSLGQTDSHPRLGESFTRMELRRDLVEVLQAVADYCRIAHWIWDHCDVTSQDESWLYLQLQALTYQLLLFREIEGVENCIRLAALPFLQNVTHYQGSQVSATTILPHLQTTIVISEGLEEPCNDELLLWCL